MKALIYLLLCVTNFMMFSLQIHFDIHVASVHKFSIHFVQFVVTVPSAVFKIQVLQHCNKVVSVLLYFRHSVVMPNVKPSTVIQLTAAKTFPLL